MSIHWYEAGQLDPAHLLDANLSLREVLKQTDGLDPDTWIAVTHADKVTYLLTHAELLGYRQRLRERLGLTPSERLGISVDALLEQCGVTPAVRVDSENAPAVDVDPLEDRLTYLGDQRMLVVGRVERQPGLGEWMRFASVFQAEGEQAALPADDPAPDVGVPPADAGMEPTESPGLMGGDSGRTEADPPGDAPPPQQVYINAVIDGYAGGPLDVDTQYGLDFSVDAQKNETPGAIAAVAADQALRPPGQAVELTVDLYGNGFRIGDTRATLHLNTQGLSVDKAHFDITPLQEGQGELTAFVSRDGNIVQKITMTLPVGPGEQGEAKVESIGRPVAEVGQLTRRRIGLHIAPEGNGYCCTVYGGASRRVHIPIMNGELATAINLLRDSLLDVVEMQDGNELVFQTRIDIPPEAATHSLRILARAGRRLFRRIFFHDSASTDCQDLGRWLIEEANTDGPGFTMQIVGDQFPVPWAALYLDPNVEWNENDINWRRFLGMKHVIEQLPMGDLRSGTQIVPAADGMGVSLNINQHIKPKDVITRQEEFWKGRARGVPALNLRSSGTTEELVASLNDAQAADRILYFYCHAKSVGLRGDGPDASSITMGENNWITLGDLRDFAPVETTLAGAPLIFLNACESAELSPLFYNGFVSYFMRKGARGVIGSECKIPVLFAEAWAKSFFGDFLDGEPLGELILMQRRRFFLEHNNILGLLYGVHCNTDTQIMRAAA